MNDGKCKWCTNGRIAVEPGSSLTYACPDCQGTGRVLVPEPPDADDGEENDE